MHRGADMAVEMRLLQAGRSLSPAGKRAIREHTCIQDATRPPEEGDRPIAKLDSPGGWPLSATVLSVLALAAIAGAVYSCTYRSSLRNLFRPPTVTLAEAYAETADSPEVDHSILDALLRRHVDVDGWVDYAALKRESASLDAYLRVVEQVDFDQLGRDEKLAQLINAYNAFTLRLILDHYPVSSIKDIPDAQRWDARRWNVGGNTWSLNQIEHEQIRPKFVEPRVHFALVCAAVGCPKLRNEAYQAERLEQQLDDQARYVHDHDRWLRYKRGAGAVRLTKLYEWYGDDFKQVAGSVLSYAARYSLPLKQALDAGQSPRIDWLSYDWKLNDQAHGCP